MQGHAQEDFGKVSEQQGNLQNTQTSVMRMMFWLTKCSIWLEIPQNKLGDE